MKTKASIFIFLLFIVQNSFGQAETRLLQRDWYVDYDNDGDFIIRNSTTNSYFPSSKIKEITVDTYNEEGVFEQRNVDFYHYNENEKLLLNKTAKRYNTTVNLWVTESWIDYTYDANGCEIKQEYIQNVGGLTSMIEYERNANCQKTKQTSWSRALVADSLSKVEVRTFSYLPDGISYEEEIFRIDFFSGEQVLHGRYLFKFNDDEVIEETQKINNLHLINGWEGRRRVFAYDQHGNIISSSNYINNFSDQDWRFNYKYIYQNEYNEQDRIIKIISKLQSEVNGELVTSPDSEIVRDFEYECEDWVAQETSARTQVGVGNGARFVYHYEGENECFDIENTALGISIYPNPTMGNLTINSLVFRSGNTQVSVFDISGKLLLEKNEFRREEKVELDLGHLPNGMYVIQLMNQEHFVQQKVVIAK